MLKMEETINHYILVAKLSDQSEILGSEIIFSKNSKRFCHSGVGRNPMTTKQNKDSRLRGNDSPVVYLFLFFKKPTGIPPDPYSRFDYAIACLIEEMLPSRSLFLLPGPNRKYPHHSI